MNPKVAVLILNWNGAQLMERYLPSVIKYTNPEIGRVIVADNCSTDDSLDLLRSRFKSVETILLDKNYGFAGGYNKAIAQVDTEYVLLLNSDVEVTERWLEPLVEVMDDDATIAGVQPKILSWSDRNRFEYAGACGGYIDHLGFPFCRGRVIDVLEEDNGQYDSVADIFWASGAALCIRRSLYMESGGLDEAFFAHMEEIDLCWRLKNRGFKFQAIPSSLVFHLGGGTLPMNHPRKLFLNYRNNLLMIYKNLEYRERRKVLLKRFFMDHMAAMIFLLQGRWSSVSSVFGAYRAFRKMRSSYQPGEGSVKQDGVYMRSIIWDYYVRRKQQFSELKESDIFHLL